MLEESSPYASLTLPSDVPFLAGGGVGPGSVGRACTESDSGAGTGVCAETEPVEGAGAGTLRSVLAGLSKSSRRLPLKRSKSSSWEGPEVTAAAAAEDQSLEAP